MSKSLLKSTALVSSLTFISRFLGFARDIIWAQVFGAVAGFDAFLVAFKIPNFMRRLFAEGAFSQAFVPVLSEYREKRSIDETKKFINHMAGALATALLVVVGLFLLLTPFVVTIFAPGFIDDPVRFSLAIHMLRITAPYLLFIALTAFSAAILNCHNNFGVAAFTPVLLNISLIIAALYLREFFAVPVVALAWGVCIGGVVQLLFQLPFLWKKGLLPLPKLAWRDEGVRRVLKLMVPALFGVSVAQISILIDTLFASFLPVGSITWLYYSERLVYFPLGIFGVALATVVLPHLSRNHVSRNSEAFSRGLDWALRMVLLFGIPSTIGLFVLSGPLLATLFQYGKFHVHDVEMARLSLMAYSVGLLGFMLIKVLASGFYSQQNIKTPVRIAAIAMVTNILLNFALIFPLKHAGLALATSLAALLNAGLLARGLLKSGTYKPQLGWGLYAVQLIVANGLLLMTLFFLSPALTQWLNWNWRHRGLYLLMLLMISAVIYFISLWLTGLRLKDFRAEKMRL